MARIPAKRGQKLIDPIHFIPDDVDELIYADADPSLTDIGLAVGGEDDFDTGIPTPKILGIVSQKIKRTKTGTVVDVVIEVEDIPGISVYEFRIAKDDK